MLNNNIYNWVLGKKITCIELVKNDLIHINSSIKSNNELNQFNFTTVNSFSDLDKSIFKNCFLIINTEKVITAKTAKNKDVAVCVSNAFPSINISEFYYSVLHTQEESVVSICRKSVVEKTIKSLNKKNINVLNVQIGYGIISELTKITRENTIQSPSFSFVISESKIQKFELVENKTITNYSIQETIIPSTHVITLAGLISHSKLNENNNAEEINENLKSKFISKLIFQKGIIISSAFMLLVLGINFILFTTFRSQYNKIQDNHSVTLLQKQKSKKQLDKLLTKEQKVSKILSRSKSSTTYYLNRISNTLPSTVLLSELTYQPLTKKVNDKKSIEVLNNVINIKGITSDKNNFSHWVESLENSHWCDNITISEFEAVSKTKDNFSLTLKIKNDL